MLANRSTARWLNGLCAFVAIGAILSIGALALIRANLARPYERQESPSLHELRETRRAALNAERIGDGAKAEQLYRKVLSQQPRLREAQFGLARTLATYGKRREAWDLYRRLHDPNIQEWKSVADRDAKAWYADLARQFGSSKLAESVARSAIGFRPDEGWRQGNKLFALVHLTAVEALSPSGIALGHAERAVELYPAASWAHLITSFILSEQNEPVKAEEELAKALALIESGTWEDWVALATFRWRSGHPEKIRPALEEAVRRCPTTDVSSLLRLRSAAFSLALGSQGPAARAVAAKVLEKALKAVRPNDRNALLQLASELSNTKDTKRAVALAMRVKAMTSPQETELYLRIVQVLSSAGKNEQALELLGEARQAISPRETAQLEAVALWYRTMRKEETAKAMLKQAIRYARPAERSRLEAELANRFTGGGGGGTSSPVLYLLYGSLESD